MASKSKSRDDKSGSTKKKEGKALTHSLTYEQWVEANILAPLGMTYSTFEYNTFVTENMVSLKYIKRTHLYTIIITHKPTCVYLNSLSYEQWMEASILGPS